MLLFGELVTHILIEIFPVISNPDDLKTANFYLNLYLHGKTTSLATQSYSQYQIKIAEIIDDKINCGWMYKSIAKMLDERGFRSAWTGPAR